MSYGIRFVELAGVHDGPGEVPAEGAWLASYDPEDHDGRGSAVWTTDIDKALRFEDSLDAVDCYRAVPSILPTRGDGRPNRPLTACTVEICKVEA
jgi:hypothetical protein